MISSCHVDIGEQPVLNQPFFKQFLELAKLTFSQSVPQWESSVTLRELRCEPHEPTEESSLIVFEDCLIAVPDYCDMSGCPFPSHIRCSFEIFILAV